MRSLRPTFVGTALAAALLLTACGGSTPDDASDGDGDGDAPAEAVSAVFSNIAETPTLDPAVAYSSDGLLFVRNVYDSLTEYEPGGTELRPALATEWEASEDSTVWTFTIRDGVTFHDGSALDAEAVAAGLRRTQEVNQGPATLMGGMESIEATGDMEVTITLDAPDVFLSGKLQKLPIVSAQAVEEHATSDDPLAQDWFASNSAGTGPYTLSTWRRNSAIELEANEDYWQEWEEGTPTQVTLRVDPDVQTALQLLQQGEIDMLGAVGPDESAAAEGMDGVKLVEQEGLLVQVVPIKSDEGPLADVRVREAISLAFDYGAMLEYYQGYADLATSALPTGFAEGLAALPVPERDVDRARELLAEAGYPDGALTMTFLGLEGLSYEEFAGTLLQDNLADIGITVEQQLVPWPQMVEIEANPETAADLSFLNMSAVTDDPSAMLRQAYHSGSLPTNGGYNWSYFVDETIDQRIDGLSTIADEAERTDALISLVEDLNDLYLAVYIAQPRLAQPVREEWEVVYEPMDYNYTVRFFYARKAA